MFMYIVTIRVKVVLDVIILHTSWGKEHTLAGATVA